MPVAFVLGGGGLLGAHEVGMLRALSEAGIRPDLVVGTSIGALNGAFVAADPPTAPRPGWARCGKARAAAGLQRESVGPGGPAGAVRDPPALPRAAGPDCWPKRLPGEEFADLALPFQCVAASIETRHRALVRQRAGGARDPGLVRRAGAAAAGRDRRPALLRRRPGGFHPGRAGRRAGRYHRLRAAGGPDREPAAGPDPAVGSGAGGVRDRPAAPVPRGDVVAAGERPGARAADRRRPAAAGPGRSSGTGTGPRSSRASSGPTRRRRAIFPPRPGSNLA